LINNAYVAPHAYITVVNGHTNGMDTVRTAPQAAAARRKRPSLAAKRVQNGPRSLLMVHEHTYCECGESYKSNHRLTGGKQGCSTGSCTSMAVDLPKKVFQASGHPKPDQKSSALSSRVQIHIDTSACSRRTTPERRAALLIRTTTAPA